MKTKANKLFLFRNMPECVNVEISQVPATNERLNKACSLFRFTVNGDKLTVIILKDVKGCKLSSSLNGGDFTPYSDSIPSGKLGGVIAAIVQYSVI